MPSYTILLTKKAQKQLDKLTNNIANPIIEAISNLENEPRPNGCKKLKGRDAYRIRSGNYPPRTRCNLARAGAQLAVTVFLFFERWNSGLSFRRNEKK